MEADPWKAGRGGVGQGFGRGNDLVLGRLAKGAVVGVMDGMVVENAQAGAGCFLGVVVVLAGAAIRVGGFLTTVVQGKQDGPLGQIGQDGEGGEPAGDPHGSEIRYSEGTCQCGECPVASGNFPWAGGFPRGRGLGTQFAPAWRVIP